MKEKAQNPLVSVIMPAHNSMGYIAEAVESVLSQTMVDWELLITDDASSDGTPEWLHSISQKDSRIKCFFFDKHSGPALTRNNSISKAKGKYIAFLDSDDKWFANKLDLQCRFMDLNACEISFSPYRIITNDGTPTVKYVDTNAPDKITYQDLLAKKATMGCLTVMYRSSTFSTLLMPEIWRGQDYAFWLSLLKKTDYACKVPEVLAEYRVTKGSLSRNKIKKAASQWSIYRNIEYLTLYESVRNFALYAFRALAKS